MERLRQQIILIRNSSDPHQYKLPIITTDSSQMTSLYAAIRLASLLPLKTQAIFNPEFSLK